MRNRSDFKRNLDWILSNPITTMIIGSIIWVIWFTYYQSHGGFLVYGDAITHLNIARSVVDNVSPGFVQLGGVWLPFLHVLLIPFISIDSLWRSGAAGSIIGYLIFIVSIFYIHKISQYLIPEVKSAGLLGSLIYITNPNILYMSMSAMTEVLFIATVTGAFYFYLKWLENRKITSLIAASWLILFTTLTRYEGWFLAIGLSIGVLLISRIGTQKTKTEGSVVLFATVALSGIFFWLLWNLAIFHDPFYFLSSMYSSKYQTLVVQSDIDKIAYKNLLMSIVTCFYSIYETGGLVIIGAALLGLLVLTFKALFLRSVKYIDLVIFILMAFFPFYFLVYAVYNGNVPIHVPQLSESTFNIRLGMYMIPTLAVSTILAISTLQKGRKYLFYFIIAAQIIFFSSSYVLPMSLRSAISEIDMNSQNTALWLKNNFDGGKILISSAVGNGIIFKSGLNYADYITDGASEELPLVYEDPSKYVNYIVVSKYEKDKKRNIVNIELEKNPDLLSNYKLVYENDGFAIYGKF